MYMKYKKIMIELELKIIKGRIPIFPISLSKIAFLP